MQIKMTGSELLEAGLWDEYCKLTGTSEWAINEGQLDSDKLLELPTQMQYRAAVAAVRQAGGNI